MTVDGSRASLRGEKHYVLDAPNAALTVVSATAEGRPAVALLTRSELEAATIVRQTVIDETRRSYRISFQDLEFPSDRLILADAALEALAAIRETALLLQSAEAVGGTQGVLDVILEYLKSRKQFGRLIGSYQALKHPTVDILCELERARSLVFHAATVCDARVGEGAVDREPAEVAVRMAKASSSDAFAFAGDRAIQFHGGFGFTYECDAQLFLRRALWLQYQFGDSRHHRTHLADLVL